MKLLLDTHALLWALAAPARLPKRVAAMVRDPRSEVLVSAASTWEIAIKAALGKLEADLIEIARAIEDTGFRALPVSIAHTVRLRSLPLHHSDPFDRLLIAQALEEGLTILTRDKAFGAYAAPTLWT